MGEGGGELDGGEVVEYGLVALAVVEDLDELEQVERGPRRGWSKQMLPRIQAISRLSVDQKVSIAALSKQSPVEPKLDL